MGRRKLLIIALSGCIAASACGSGSTRDGVTTTETSQLKIAPATRTVAEAARPSARVELEPAPQFLHALSLQRAIVDDPVYQTRKEYEGYGLVEVLAAAGVPTAATAPDRRLVFRCADGYRPFTSLHLVLRDQPVLAIRDLRAPENVPWEPFRRGRELMTPAPFYLVWPRTPNSNVRPWPYQIVALEVWEPNTPVSNAITGASPAIHTGQTLFEGECAACHSLNLLGGTVGPELNVPANVTEYWHPAALRRFIRNPAAIRAGSRMPAFSHLSDADLDNVIGYLEFMLGEKVRTADDPP